jgi:serine/threonine protein kinase
MGEVHRTDDLTLVPSLPLKYLPERLATNSQPMAGFLAEVRIVLHTNHFNVCAVYDIEQIDGQQFISMEYVDGEDLSFLFRRVVGRSRHLVRSAGQRVLPIGTARTTRR